MLKPLQLTHYDLEEQWLCSKSLLNDQAPPPISNGQPSHLSKEINLYLYLRPHSFSHYLELVIIGEGRNIAQPLN